MEEIRANCATFTEDEVERHNYTVLCMDVDVVYKVKELSEFSAKRFALFSFMEKRIKENYNMWTYKNSDGARLFIVDLRDSDKLYKIKMLIDNVQHELETDLEYNAVDEREEEEHRYPYEKERRIITAMRKNDEGLLKEAFIDFLSALGNSESADKIFLHQLAVHVELMLKETYGLNENVRLHLQEFSGMQ